MKHTQYCEYFCIHITFSYVPLLFQVAARSRGLYDVTFVAQEAIPHFVNVTFNEEDVPGKSTWKHLDGFAIAAVCAADLASEICA